MLHTDVLPQLYCRDYTPLLAGRPFNDERGVDCMRTQEAKTGNSLTFIYANPFRSLRRQ